MSIYSTIQEQFLFPFLTNSFLICLHNKAMLNGREKIAILALSLFFSALMVCFCFVLVIHFIMEMASVTDGARRHHEVLWAGFGIALFMIFAFAFVVFAIFSGCGVLYIIQSSIKVVPAPATPIEGEQQHLAMV